LEGLREIPAARIVVGTDYPQQIRSNAVCGRFVQAIHDLADGEAIPESKAKVPLKK
jgi:hypothetical protein